MSEGHLVSLVFTVGALSTHACEQKMCDLQNTEAPGSQVSSASFARNRLLLTSVHKYRTRRGPGGDACPRVALCRVRGSLSSVPASRWTDLASRQTLSHGEPLSEGRVWRVARHGHEGWLGQEHGRTAWEAQTWPRKAKGPTAGRL